MNMRALAYSACVAILALGAALFIASPPKAQPTVGLPFATSVSVTTSAAQLIGSNPTRRALTICTPGSTNVVAIAPAPITPAQPAGPGIIITGTATASNCFTTPLVQSGGAGGGVGNAWNAVASGTTIVLVLEY